MASAIVDAPSRPLEVAGRRDRRPRPPCPSPPGSRRPGRSTAGSTSWPAGGSASSAGKRVGLVTNHTGRTKDGGLDDRPPVRGPPAVELVALFSPEHGIRGAVDTNVRDDSKDEKTGLTDLQPLRQGPEALGPSHPERGPRCWSTTSRTSARAIYTYISTLGLVLEAAKENHLPVVVLDRPNPIDGLAVAGPGPRRRLRLVHRPPRLARPARPDRRRAGPAVQRRAIHRRRPDRDPVRRLAAGRQLRADRPWNGSTPRPTCGALTEALLYPGIGLLEASNLATGRGTDTPFERLGRPLDRRPRPSPAPSTSEALPGVRFVPCPVHPQGAAIRQPGMPGGANRP